MTVYISADFMKDAEFVKYGFNNTYPFHCNE